VYDPNERGTRLKWLPVLDEYTRECITSEVESSITAKDVVQTLERLVEERCLATLRPFDSIEAIYTQPMLIYGDCLLTTSKLRVILDIDEIAS
jgi:hypothetical protein